jgi:hypothetical protein
MGSGPFMNMTIDLRTAIGGRAVGVEPVPETYPAEAPDGRRPLAVIVHGELIRARSIPGVGYDSRTVGEATTPPFLLTMCLAATLIVELQDAARRAGLDVALQQEIDQERARLARERKEGQRK